MLSHFERKINAQMIKTDGAASLLHHLLVKLSRSLLRRQVVHEDLSELLVARLIGVEAVRKQLRICICPLLRGEGRIHIHVGNAVMSLCICLIGIIQLVNLPLLAGVECFGGGQDTYQQELAVGVICTDGIDHRVEVSNDLLIGISSLASER